MTTAKQVLDVARSQLGTVESPPNSNRTKYGKAYGMDGQPWCNMFTWWCFQESGGSSLTPKSAYTPATFDYYKKSGRIVTKPEPGDLAFFDFPNDGVNRISHIGFVEKVNPDGSVIMLEANTSPGDGGSQRDGGGVYRRVRRSGIVAYARPAYTGAAQPTARSAAAGPSLATLRRGSKGALVTFLQTKINARHSPKPQLLVDGDFGGGTEKAVIDIQKHLGLKPDGVVGPATWARI